MSFSPAFISKHPVVASKISNMRARETDARQFRLLTSEVSSLLAYEATFESLSFKTGAAAVTPIGEPYHVLDVTPERICLVPILRSGLGMVDAFLALLPCETEVHHLGLFREKDTLNAVEYYNKLPHPRISGHIHTAFIIDPIIATGNTACAAIQIMKEWGVKRIVFSCILASKTGLERVKKEWPEGVILHVGRVDETLNQHGYIVPGLGDIGDRLYETRY